ncbi:amidohydrolase [Salinarchaeum sp. Harcht-Bsk1]|uniref:amidohydrolase n=1 Tax=Salinarchaeum sp. Harcht-Bsk1 TaxID=1333523 RepID=UPI00034238D5|nr:amidohydrolase [Salinarchaeum sp. Harcht-Bsk1]AGN02320.1 amidohydrolase [Salinarchaeum sp. Harcht-Bsk1]
MATATEIDRLVDLRRDLHRHPEPAWREFYTTARIVEACREIGVDDLHVGPDALASDARMAVPDDETLSEWSDRALEAGADEAIVSQLEGGHTGLIAELHRGEGPTVALRVDIDGLPRAESDDPEHVPAAEGFRSENEGAMHACGHDGHAAIGVGVLRAIAESDDFAGTLKVIFQPAEEQVGGAKAVAESGHLDDVDALLAIHLGLDHPTGEIVAGVEGFLAVAQVEAEFEGEPAHAGGRPEQGRNANQAMAAAIQNLYAIPRHSDGPTRVNAGIAEGGTASNVIPEYARLVVEVRGETTPLMEYVDDRARSVLEGAATMHECDLTISEDGRAPSATSDDELRDVVGAVAKGHADVERVLDRDDLAGSEDATYLMQAVQDNGGLAAYVGVGTDHPGGHHTATFDVDEDSIGIGVDVLSESIERIAADLP